MQPTFFPSSCPQVYIHIRFAHIHPYPFNFNLLFYCTSLVPMSILTLNSIFGKYKKKIYVCFDLEANKISKAILFFDQKIDKILVVVVKIAYWYSQVPIK